MKNKALNAQTHRFAETDSLLPDANFWLYLYGPQPSASTWAVNAYSAIYKALLTARAKLFLDVLILSEFINSYARLEWRIASSGQDFKQFRKSSAFKSIAQNIANQANRILKDAVPLDHHFTNWKLADLLNDFSTGAFDCNDQFLVECCRKHGLCMLTNDADFTEGGLTVYTANSRLLTACPP